MAVSVAIAPLTIKADPQWCCRSWSSLLALSPGNVASRCIVSDIMLVFSIAGNVSVADNPLSFAPVLSLLFGLFLLFWAYHTGEKRYENETPLQILSDIVFHPLDIGKESDSPTINTLKGNLPIQTQDNTWAIAAEKIAIMAIAMDSNSTAPLFDEDNNSIQKS